MCPSDFSADYGLRDPRRSRRRLSDPTQDLLAKGTFPNNNNNNKNNNNNNNNNNDDDDDWNENVENILNRSHDQ